jgi:hypothetical protein
MVVGGELARDVLSFVSPAPDAASLDRYPFGMLSSYTTQRRSKQESTETKRMYISRKRMVIQAEGAWRKRFRWKGSSSGWSVCCDQHSTPGHRDRSVAPIPEAKQVLPIEWNWTLKLEVQIGIDSLMA